MHICIYAGCTSLFKKLHIQTRFSGHCVPNQTIDENYHVVICNLTIGTLVHRMLLLMTILMRITKRLLTAIRTQPLRTKQHVAGHQEFVAFIAEQSRCIHRPFPMHLDIFRLFSNTFCVFTASLTGGGILSIGGKLAA